MAKRPPRASSREALRGYGPDAAYESVIAADRLDAYQWFVEVYPDHPYAGRVWRIIETRREQILWRRTLAQNTPRAYWNYFERYPDGPHSAEAERRLEWLRAERRPPPGYVVEPEPLPPGWTDEAVGIGELVPRGRPAPPSVFETLMPLFIPPPPRFEPPRRPPPAFVVAPPPAWDHRPPPLAPRPPQDSIRRRPPLRRWRCRRPAPRPAARSACRRPADGPACRPGGNCPASAAAGFTPAATCGCQAWPAAGRHRADFTSAGVTAAATSWRPTRPAAERHRPNLAAPAGITAASGRSQAGTAAGRGGADTAGRADAGRGQAKDTAGCGRPAATAPRLADASGGDIPPGPTGRHHAASHTSRSCARRSPWHRHPSRHSARLHAAAGR